MSALLKVQSLSKGFTLHLHGGTHLPVVHNVAFEVAAGECVVLGGPSGAGKSSILKMIYGNYLASGGSVLIHRGSDHIDVIRAQAPEIIELRRSVMGYVSQFLRTIPRVPAIDIVAEPALAAGLTPRDAQDRAANLLQRLNLPERLWSLPPSTFSGGEQQRVNIARGFAGNHTLLILDEPTASLDQKNREAVTGLMSERKNQGAALVGIFHDDDVRARVADRIIDVAAFAPKEAA